MRIVLTSERIEINNTSSKETQCSFNSHLLNRLFITFVPNKANSRTFLFIHLNKVSITLTFYP